MKIDIKNVAALKKGDRVLYNGAWLTVSYAEQSEKVKSTMHVKFEEADMGTHIQKQFLICYQKQ